jgi:chaperone required for assembly of F1-ATPase
MRRVYRTVAVVPRPCGYGIALDDRPVSTPAARPLIVPSRALADAIAAEWQAQGDKVVPATMPMQQLANGVVDRIAPEAARIVDLLVAYAETDLLCHWAEGPDALVQRQRRHWQPLLDWSATDLDAPLRPVAGIMAQRQPDAALAALRTVVAALEPFALGALNVLTTGTGSLLIGLAVVRGRLSLEEAWQAAQVDEAYQAEQWGEDEEATARRAAIRADLAAAVRFLQLAAQA